MAVGIADVAAHPGLVLSWRRQELGTPRAPLGVDSLDVRNPDVEEAAHPIWVVRRLERETARLLRLAVAATPPSRHMRSPIPYHETNRGMLGPAACAAKQV